MIDREKFLMGFNWQRAQSFVDYAFLIAIIAVSLAAMSGYVFKSINARIFHVWADLTSPLTGVR